MLARVTRPIPTTPPLLRLPDGTVKQMNPLTGTEVWTVPGRGNRPLVSQASAHQRLSPGDRGRHCAFCQHRMLETPPEKARRVATEQGWSTLHNLTAEELNDTTAEFRLIPNLFEIVSLNYWRSNHGFRLTEPEIERRRAYLATPLGRQHVLDLVSRHRRAGLADEGDDAILNDSILGGFHDVIVARRHHVDGADCDDELASSGTMTPEEHREYVDFTLEATRALFDSNLFVRNVVVFQNWLRPAGASFDHLHKQLVGIDELGRWRDSEVARLREDPALFTRCGLDMVTDHGLLVASNEHAIAFAGVGHRYPSLEVWTRRLDCDLWNISPEELRDFSDLLHACHAASGPLVPCNEEWHYRPPSLDLPMPLRVVVKWRISTPAGFEGGSRIYVNTIDPWTLRDRAHAALTDLAAADRLAPGIALA